MTPRVITIRAATAPGRYVPAIDRLVVTAASSWDVLEHVASGGVRVLQGERAA